MTDFTTTRALFRLPTGVVYLDGNSLGAMPVAAAERAGQVIEQEWGGELIRAWNSAGWITLPTRVGDRIARLIGAPVGSVTTGDTLTVKVFQAVAAAVALRPERRVILSDSGNFPTDLYVTDALLKALGRGLELKIVRAGRCRRRDRRQRRGDVADRGRLPDRAAARHGRADRARA